jgi:uncharacterized protein (TIGR02996 family)
MTEEELLAAVLAAPEEDAPRLVYADWLMERGDPRGEYIGLMVQAARLDRWDPARVELEQQARRVFGGRRKDERETTHRFYERGFVSEVYMNGEQLRERPELLARWPVVSLKLWRVANGDVPLLARQRWAARLRRLELYCVWQEASTVPAELTDALGGSLRRLRGLHISESNTALAGAVVALPELDELGLHNLTEEQVDHFAPALRRVRSLACGHQTHVAHAVTHAKALDALTIASGNVGAILEAPALSRLRSLRASSDLLGACAWPLEELTIDGYGPTPLPLETPSLAGLKRLRLRASLPLDLAPLLAALPDELRELRLDDRINVHQMRQIAKRELPKLTTLMTWASKLGDAGAAEVADLHWPALRRLVLRNGALGNGPGRAALDRRFGPIRR